jgi:leucyl-tRNA synthetase
MVSESQKTKKSKLKKDQKSPNFKVDKREKKMKEYNHSKIEKKWIKEWEKKKVYQALDKIKKKKFYGLIEFPYPSGSGLHVGHIRSNTAMDIICRKRRMEGYNVLYPIGWDAFGLPTENYAIQTGIHPIKVTKQNTDIFRRQLKALGFSFDWSREINTTDPEYYKWTQWIFLQMFKKGLAYKSKTKINWCLSCKIGLANEEVVNGVCERCSGEVVLKEKEQWILAITKYADRLDKDLDQVDYLEKIKIQQRNWIGKSEGSEIEFKVIADPSLTLPKGKGEVLVIQKNLEVLPFGEDLGGVNVFTTRADTILGATYVVLAPEHSIVINHKSKIINWEEVEDYIQKAKKKNDLDRLAEDKVKTGVELKGIKAINPANQKEIPIWIADYVLASYGTGAIMAVPQHDERDKAFAVKFNLPIVDEPLVSAKEITLKVGGKMVTRYKLRDWIFSRQRYWGEPIPIIHCQKCGQVPVKEKDLPVVLPKVKSYQPTDNGESPLATISKWVNVQCPKCKGFAKRETDTMPNWAGSSWYFLRYVDPKNKKEFANKKNLKYWLKGGEALRQAQGDAGGVDWYNGGMEHTTLHLLYSRFWHKFLYDLKLVPTSEPYFKRTSHGMILAENGEKMSKSKGNVVNPEEIIKLYGADTLRIYEMFIGPFDQAVSWQTDSIIGSRRFLEKVWRFGQKVISENQNDFSGPRISSHKMFGQTIQNHSDFLPVQKLLHKTIKKVFEDIESMNFNTAISAMMVFVNEAEKIENLEKEDLKSFLKILAPFAPHLTEEIWFSLGERESIHLSSWPKWDPKKVEDQEIKIAVQVNGKVRTEWSIDKSISEEEIKIKVFNDESLKPWLKDSEIKKIIYVPGRIVNIVV